MQTQTHGMLEELRRCNIEQNLEASDRLASIANSLYSIDNRFSDLHSDISLEKLGKSFSHFSSDVEGMSQINSILSSLRFESMTVRHSNITEAHKRTFDWIFSTNCLPAEDPRSKIGFSSWLEHGGGLYWITGKPGILSSSVPKMLETNPIIPGSGKSTLMKYLEDHPMTNQLLHSWSQPSHLVTASFYIWNSGTMMQKSLQGLLQSLLYTILSSCPDLIPVLCPERWANGRFSASASFPWSVKDLKRALQVVKWQTSLPVQFYLHIDGLDEYEGKDHGVVIEILQDLSNSPAVKLCVSSRPWNCFNDTIGKANAGTLQLHELTEEDIELFAEENIISYGKSIRNRTQSQDYTRLVQEIRKRAQGVFLWVRLVVHSLRDGLTNDDPMSLLRQRLEELPTDLEAFFEHILSSVNEIYQKRMACTFLAALQSVDPLKLIHYSFLDEFVEDPQFGFVIPFKPFDSSEIQRRVEQAQCRLNGRYKGLLEPSSTTRLTPSTTVDFLHRTLRDFLQTRRMRSFLQERLPDQFNVRWAISSALLADAKFMNGSPRSQDFAAVLRFAGLAADEMSDRTFEYRILEHVELAYQQLSPSVPGRDAGHLVLDIALHIGRIDYIEHKLESDTPMRLGYLLMHGILCPLVRNKSFANIFEEGLYAFCDSASAACGTLRYCAGGAFVVRPPLETTPESTHTLNLQPELVRFLLKNGADPNETVDGISIWPEFLSDLSDQEHIPRNKQWWDVFKLMISHGANVKNQTSIWIKLIRAVRFFNVGKKRFQCVMSIFSTLLDHKLDPNATVDRVTIYDRRNSIWLNFLDMLTTKDFDVTETARLRDLLHSFLNNGADITSVYADFRSPEDSSISESWLDFVLSQLCDNDSIMGHIDPVPIFDVFLSHGLDPNTSVRGSTIWDKILGALYNGFRNPSNGAESYWPMSHDVIILFLQYRADPHAEQLYEIVGWARGTNDILLTQYAEKIEQAIRREINDLESRVREPSTHTSVMTGIIAPTSMPSGQPPYRSNKLHAPPKGKEVSGVFGSSSEGADVCAAGKKRGASALLRDSECQDGDAEDGRDWTWIKVPVKGKRRRG